ncbi:MAG: Tm-1-like ATP-binding domain-containing protein [Pirellulaceae bacterium]
MIGGVLDITTTEVADEVVGGVFAAGPSRFEAILERRIPYVMSLGACDMVNFGARAKRSPTIFLSGCFTSTMHR